MGDPTTWDESANPNLTTTHEMPLSYYMDNSDLYAFDEAHPIPNLDVVDINIAKQDGGSDLFIVIATPLPGDRRSLKRMLRKIERCLEFIQSEDFPAEGGPPSPENTNIIVKIHPNSSHLAFELLRQSVPWVMSNDASLLVDTQL